MKTPSLKSCKIIYQPPGEAGEYSRVAARLYDGCGHRCRYCWVPLARHMDAAKRAAFNSEAVLIPDYLKRLERDARVYQAAGVREQVLLSFTTDPYHPGDTAMTREAIRVLQTHGLGVCVLTKGGSRALRDIRLFRPTRDAFASTLTSLDDDFSRKWEPRAALPMDRVKTLCTFHARGVFTWVSLEPTLDCAASLEIVRRTHEFVDLYKVGRVNYQGELTSKTDWRSYTLRMVDLTQKLGARVYFKRDLQRYLPDDYPEQVPVPQYHEVRP